MSAGVARALLDANIFISYLLGSSGQGTILTPVEAAFARTITLLVSDALSEEFVRRVQTKPYLAQRIAPRDLERLTDMLLHIAERLPPLPQKLPAVVRDPEDDYPIAHSLLGRADYPVTGDWDLLAWGTVGQVRIISPSEFVRELGIGGDAAP